MALASMKMNNSQKLPTKKRPLGFLTLSGRPLIRAFLTLSQPKLTLGAALLAPFLLLTLFSDL
jgi:hypothetical protein